MSFLLVLGDGDILYRCFSAPWQDRDSAVIQKEMCHIVSHQHHYLQHLWSPSWELTVTSEKVKAADIITVRQKCSGDGSAPLCSVTSKTFALFISVYL